MNSTIPLLLAVSVLFLASGCDTDDAEETLPESVRMLNVGEFSVRVQGGPSVRTDLSGNAYYGTSRANNKDSFQFLFVGSQNQAHVLTLTHQGETEPEDDRSYQIADAFADSTAINENAFLGRYRVGSEYYLSQSGGMYLFEQRDGEIFGQFHFAAKGRRDSSAAFPIGSFRAIRADNFDQFVEDRFNTSN